MNRIRIAPGIFFHLAFLLLIVPVRWIGGFLFAALIHEMGHVLALKLLKVPILGFRMEVSGAVIETGQISSTQELLCAAAGPSAGFLAVLTARYFPVFSLCALVQTVFNLIPVYPSDGGRMLRCLLNILFPEKDTTKIITVLSLVTLVAMTGISCYLFRFKALGIIPLLSVALLARKWLKQKNSLQRSR